MATRLMNVMLRARKRAKWYRIHFLTFARSKEEAIARVLDEYDLGGMEEKQWTVDVERRSKVFRVSAREDRGMQP